MIFCFIVLIYIVLKLYNIAPQMIERVAEGGPELYIIGVPLLFGLVYIDDRVLFKSGLYEYYMATFYRKGDGYIFVVWIIDILISVALIADIVHDRQSMYALRPGGCL